MTTANALAKSVPVHPPPQVSILPTLGKLYCRIFHREISRPYHGRYRCWKCLREFDSGWTRQTTRLEAGASGRTVNRETGVLRRILKRATV